jgi:hypothetical protein
MASPPAARISAAAESGIRPLTWPLQLLLFALLFTALMLLHAPLLRLPYFWDEAGYYVPVARDLMLTGSPIPHSTVSNAHPPLVMAWLALVWRVFGYSTLVARTAMLALAAFSLLGLFRLGRAAANPQVALAVAALTAIYPVFFTQSSLALVDLPAAGFTFWALTAYVEDRPWTLVMWFSVAALAKETAIVAPVALCAWQGLAPLIGRWRKQLVPPSDRRTGAIHLFLPIVPLALWFAYHRVKTGFVFGNPDFFRYNVAATLNPLRIPIAFALRLWQAFGYLGLYVLMFATLLALLRPPQADQGKAHLRIAIWQQVSFAVVTLAYLFCMSVLGGAVLARYLLPVLPLVILFCVATLWRRVRFWKPIVACVIAAFALGLFTNPPYNFSLEDNLAYRDFVQMHAEASWFLTMRYPNARVLTAWPASDELSRPWLGYVARPFRVVRIEDFSLPEVNRACLSGNDAERKRCGFDVAFVFCTKYQPAHPPLENFAAWRRIGEAYFGYHRDLAPEEITQRLGGNIVFQKTENRLWVAVIDFSSANAAARPLAITPPANGRNGF